MLTIKELSIRWKLKPNTIYKKVCYKEIPHSKIGGNLRFRLKDIEDYEEANRWVP